MVWRKPNVKRLAARGDRRGLAKALTCRDEATRLAAAEALLTDSLSVAEVEALGPALVEASGSEAPGALDLAAHIAMTFGQARWRAAIPVLGTIYDDGDCPAALREAVRQALEAIQPGLTDPQSQVPDTPQELRPRTVMERGVLIRGGLVALKDFLERMPLCGFFSTADIPRTAREEALRAGNEHFRDRRLHTGADFSGTRDEVSQTIVHGLYEICAQLGRKSVGFERAIIQPHQAEGIPGLAEVRTLFGLELGYVDLVARGDRDWYYYWGTEG